MSALGTTFRQGQTLKAEDLNLMVEAINNNADVSQQAKQTAENNTRALDILKASAVDISESEFESLQQSGTLDPDKTYYVYEG